MTPQLIGHPQPFFSLLELDAADAAGHASAIPQLRDGKVTGIVIRNVYPRELMQTDPDTYFQQADEFHQHMRQLLPEPFGIEGHVMKLLSKLDANRHYRAAPGLGCGSVVYGDNVSRPR